MKRVIACLVSFVFLTSCYAEIPTETQVRNMVNLYLEGMMYHQYSDEYTKEYGDVVFHPDANALGDQRPYKSIDENLIEHPGINIVTKATIDSVFSSPEKVYPGQNIRDGEKSYFVRVVFHTVAIQGKQGIKVLTNPINIVEYFILGNDKNDDKYKIIDSFPDPSALFINLEYAIKKVQLIARITQTENVPKLEKDLRLQKDR